MAKGFKNEERYKIHNQYFEGGVSIDPKIGVANSFYQSQGLDFRSVPSQLSVLPGARTLATNLQDTITAMVQDVNGVRYGVGDGGGFYRINTSNVVSKIAQLDSNGSAGLYYNQVTDQIYIPSQTTVSLYGQVTSGNPGNPTFRSAQFGKSASTAPGCVNLFDLSSGYYAGLSRNNSQSITTGITSTSQVTTNATQTYALKTTYAENVVEGCYFSPDIEPFYSIAVYIAAKGTGNWTLTLHDSVNNQLAAVTITNANLTSGAYNEFVFGKQIRALVNAAQTGNNSSYHFHLTSTVADGTVGTINESDFTSTDFLLFAYRLLQTNNGWHPTAFFNSASGSFLCVGNGPYLSTYNFGNDTNPLNSMWNRHALTLNLGHEVCGLTTNNQYLVIATEKRSTTANRNFQEGALYFWDGTTAQPNFKIDIPMGAPYGVYTFNNVTFFCVGGSL